jgi:hypothetical protein
MNMNGICKVCELIDNDKSIKPIIFCEFCNANICKSCEPNLLRRAKAMLLNLKK